MDKDKLENVIVSEWPNLRDLFANNWPEHMLAYRTIQHYIDIKEHNSLYRVQIFCLNGDWSDGTFLTFDGFHLQVYTMEESCARLQKAIEVMPKNIRIRICTPERFVQAVKKALRKCKGFKFEDLHEIITNFYCIPKEEALKFDCKLPENSYISAIDLKHAKHINSLWPHRFQCSEYFEYGPHFGTQNGVDPKEAMSSEDWIKDMIAVSDSVGLYNKNDDELMSWVMILHNDGLCALQTDDKHLRKGYGKFVIKNISKTLASKGKDTFCYIVDGNSPPINLFESLGFQALGRTYWYDLIDFESAEELLELKRLYA